MLQYKAFIFAAHHICLRNIKTGGGLQAPCPLPLSRAAAHGGGGGGGETPKSRLPPSYAVANLDAQRPQKSFGAIAKRAQKATASLRAGANSAEETLISVKTARPSET